ncbi:MAG: tRNA (adenosine(37)-N6)-threonylcarbamoyltransferase complex transferase subunit TsaD [Chloroflexi bacterium]|nr:tRNA (adenosine(37)-N6)-threonylcarbamoyltransferase complex transferase subunit TsaD [Chloroflexota bacterium]
MTRILGIETSCDETAAAVVRDGRFIESNRVAAQIELHRRYGGVVPEVASRAHLATMLPVLQEALEQAQVGWSGLDAVAVTYGPGLAGALLVGLNVAKALAYARGLPLIGVNHLEGHVYANWLVADGAVADGTPPFPFVCLIVSGGHSDLVLVEQHLRYRRLGRTRDDAAGEAFDKAARILGLGYPGGPAIQQAAEQGDRRRFPLPRAWLAGSSDFSFSGLKTALLRLVASLGQPLPVADLAASFQDAVVDVLVSKTVQAARDTSARAITLGGGVAANLPLRQHMAERSPVPVYCPPVPLCTDNGAMIAAAGFVRYQAGARSGLDLDVVPNLPIA